jgi:hypothetical protein
MSLNYSPGRTNFDLLPEPEGRLGSFVISSTLNAAIAVTLILAGMMAKHVIQQHYEMTELIAPTTPPPPEHIRQPPPKLPPPPAYFAGTFRPFKLEMPRPPIYFGLEQNKRHDPTK